MTEINPVRIDHITKTSQAATDLIDAINDLRALHMESNALDFSNALIAGDFTGENAHLAPADIMAVTGTTLAALEVLLGQGHATNLHKVRA